MQRRSLLRSIAATGVGLSVGTGVGAGRTRSTDGYAPIGRQHVDGAAEVVVDEDGTTTYVAADTGFAVVDAADPADPTVLAEVRDVAADREDGPLTSILDLAVDGDRLLVSGPAAAGDLEGLVVYDVSDPADPVPATEFYETGFGVHNASLADGYAYLTNNRPLWRPLTVVDVSRDAPGEVARWSPREYDPGVEGWTDRVGLPWSLHDVTVRGEYAYCSYWDAGTWILDVSDPASPSFVSRVGPYTIEEVVELADSEGDELFETSMQAPGNDHSAALDEAGDLLAVGGEGWDVGEPDPGGIPGIRLYDVSDVDAPRRLATIDAPRVEDDGLDGTWVSAHNFDVVEGRLFSAWYQAGVKVHDVSDPSNPELLAWWRDPGETAFWAARHATSEFFVATSYHRDAGLAEALLTFPNRPGRQADPPASLPWPGDRPGPTTGTTTADDATTTTDDGPDETTTTDPPTTGDATTSRDPTAASTEGPPPVGTPGLGVGASVLGLALGLEAWRRVRRSDD